MTQKPTPLFTIAAAAVCALVLAACGRQTTDEKIKQQLTENVHSLNADERRAAETNAKQFYNKQWPVKMTDGSMGVTNGFWSECRPSDSNANGMVTCSGKVPQITGGFLDVVRYCGYRPELVGCSDADK